MKNPISKMNPAPQTGTHDFLWYGIKFARYQALSLLLVLLGFFCLCPPVRAKNPVSLRISPLNFDLKIDPGEEKNGKIYIENTSVEDVAVSSEFSDFFVDSTGNYIFSDDKEIGNEQLKPYLMKEWLSLNENDFLLKKGEYKVLEYKIKAPADAVLGGHYGVIFLRTKCATEKDDAIVATDKSSICVTGRVGTLLLVQAGGDAVRKGALKKVDVPKLSWEDESNLEIEIENVGNTHFSPEGNVEMKNIWGQKMADFPIGDRMVLPTTSVKFKESIQKQDLVGFYRLSGNITDGDGNSIFFKRFLFMPPWKETAIAFLALFVFFWAYKNLKMKRKYPQQT